MPRLDPRQRLLREALLYGAAGSLALIAALWWVLRAPAALPGLSGLAGQANDAMAPSPAALPSASLWRPLNGTAETAPSASAPAPPTMRLISLSRREGRWTALIDPGDGAAAQRVTGGERVAGWLVDAVGQDGVELSAEGRRHQLRFGP